jgi:hypothetical protein
LKTLSSIYNQINDIFTYSPGLEPAAFAALVPNSADKVLDEVIEEIMGDHEMLVSLGFYQVLCYSSSSPIQ